MTEDRGQHVITVDERPLAKLLGQHLPLTAEELAECLPGSVSDLLLRELSPEVVTKIGGAPAPEVAVDPQPSSPSSR